MLFLQITNKAKKKTRKKFGDKKLTCKGICERYRATCHGIELRYANGQKRCVDCAIYLRWEGLLCPCCKNKLRTRPRHIQSHRKFLEVKNHGM